MTCKKGLGEYPQKQSQKLNKVANLGWLFFLKIFMIEVRWVHLAMLARVEGSPLGGDGEAPSLLQGVALRRDFLALTQYTAAQRKG